jgi:hypothetical protein
MIILAVDPGATQSGYCLFNDGSVTSSGVTDNGDMLEIIRIGAFDILAVEMVASYGMSVGKSVFDTCVWVGRFTQAYYTPGAVIQVFRKDVKLHLCGTFRAKDTNVRQALIDMFARTGGGKTPQVGTKVQPGPLFGVSSHAWSALAVAVTTSHHLGMAEAA